MSQLLYSLIFGLRCSDTVYEFVSVHARSETNSLPRLVAVQCKSVCFLQTRTRSDCFNIHSELVNGTCTMLRRRSKCKVRHLLMSISVGILCSHQ